MTTSPRSCIDLESLSAHLASVKKTARPKAPASVFSAVKTVYDELIDFQAKGFSIAEMCKFLSDGGVTIKPDVLRSYMTRIRRQQKPAAPKQFRTKPTKAAPAPAAPPPAPAKAAPPAPPPRPAVVPPRPTPDAYSRRLDPTKAIPTGSAPRRMSDDDL